MPNPNARFHLSVENSVCIGDEFVVQVLVDSSEAAINAAQGALVYDPAQLTPVAVRYGDSVLRYWVTPPSLPDSPGEIPFVGGLPFPGFSGNGGPIMSVVFRAEKENVSARLSFGEHALALLNDGKATEAILVTEGAQVALLPETTAVCTTGPSKKVSLDDTTPPLPFEVIITNSPKAFDGEHFAVFDTVDEGTGVDHYEVKESSLYTSTTWLHTDSPYHLQTQGGEVLVEVRAIDGAGNIRYASTSGTLESGARPMGIHDAFFLGAIVLVGLLIYMLCRKRRAE